MILNLNNINVEQAQKSSEKFVIIPVNDWIELMAQKQQEAAVKKVTRPTTPKVKTPAVKPAKGVGIVMKTWKTFFNSSMQILSEANISC